MPTTHHQPARLPTRFDELVRMMPPQAILDDHQYDNTLKIIDRLMSAGRLTKDQSLYLETLVQLVHAYEATHHAIDISNVSGVDSLKHLLSESGMNASDLARLLGAHPSLGSKILNGERSLTVEHLRKLTRHFKVRAEIFMD